MSDIELKPCPFCGSQNVYHAQSSELSYYIMCGKCGASSDYLTTKQCAAEAWSKRVTKADTNDGANENKTEICAKLGELLKLTRAGADIEKIGYDAEKDCAVIYFKSAKPYGIRCVNTAGDSGAQLIADVLSEVF